ncbi:type II toxin-antitoxin system HigB family toxin [Billgrantia ethanolica]|uniref:Type II toxin-antitoxin system HigB family toxin n=1 Tax=Billgrantia ethanolica TaxID=2733486 RepID=A0ABS9A051_9GAMM|nr:type II toxin-antitoxin system HigB family toxin [Halomonas ethanolica]MCE8002193.1 type II toxin-antitoxin system HigB family toxin [Halomonas ethanolica]
MRIVTRKVFEEASRAYPNDAHSLQRTYKLLKSENFPSPAELKKTFPSLDNFRYKDRWWVIDIAGNHLRLIAFISFEQQILYVKHITTHADYDKLCRRYAKEADS